jgi:hypothetical protein
MSKSLEDRLAAVGEEAEAGEEDQTVKPIPAHVKVTRGNPRSKVLQVRLNPDEHAAIERIAERRGLPASTIAREELLKLIADEDAPHRPLEALVAAADRVKALAVDVAYAGEGSEIHIAESKRADKDANRAVHPMTELGARDYVSVSKLLEALGIAEQQTKR